MKITNLGFPRIGMHRELKKGVEAYWKGKIGITDLNNIAYEIKTKNFILQKDCGIDLIPVNDFSFYDHVLDMSFALGVIPERFKNLANDNDYNDSDLYFAMARGIQDDKYDIVPMEMTKWFDTNYHYIVPEFEKNQVFSLDYGKIGGEIEEAMKIHRDIKPVLIGPFTFLKLGKTVNEEFDKLDLLPDLLIKYEKILEKMQDSGITWVQFDEPYMVSDLNNKDKEALIYIYNELNRKFKEINIMLTTYFGSVERNKDIIGKLDIRAFHLDLSDRASTSVPFDKFLLDFPEEIILSLGIVNGRNIWKNNFSESLNIINKTIGKLGSDRVWLAPSCSLIHCPIDIDLETENFNLPCDVKELMAFSKQKLEELSVLKKLVIKPQETGLLEKNIASFEKRKDSKFINVKKVREARKAVKESDYTRKSSYIIRKRKQQSLNLPVLPTTTIGSLPQTSYIRSIRRKWKKGLIDNTVYEDKIKESIADALIWQAERGLDVLVHGEFERNDMVEYFAGFINGYAFTRNGWVQSYGTRLVKPPVIYGDLSRKCPMTVKWSKYANDISANEVKGMLTGPVTMLRWSFVRDDQPEKDTLLQLALVIREEVSELEKAGISIIQIDEPAFREGMPLNSQEQSEYFKTATRAFRLSSSCVNDETQIHTHMCYSEFNEIIKWIADMDADVITIEASRSNMELLEAFKEYKYPNDIGPGVYDIHSPRIPDVDEIIMLLRKALKYITAERLWVNPDCGLKTRAWKEADKSLRNMVKATKILRQELIV